MILLGIHQGNWSHDSQWRTLQDGDASQIITSSSPAHRNSYNIELSNSTICRPWMCTILSSLIILTVDGFSTEGKDVVCQVIWRIHTGQSEGKARRVLKSPKCSTKDMMSIDLRSSTR